MSQQYNKGIKKKRRLKRIRRVRERHNQQIALKKSTAPSSA